MNTNKRICYALIIIFSFCFFKIDVKAIDSNTSWDSNTEEIVYSYQASNVGIRRIWLDCTGASTTTITLYTKGFTKERITGRVGTNNLPNGSYVCKAHVETGGDKDDKESDGDVSFTKKNFDPNNSNNNINNPDGTSKSCDSLDKEEDCTRAACRWNKNRNVCENAFVAENPCSENSIKKVLRFFGYILMIAKVIIPLLIIGFGTFDLFKSVIDKDEKSLTKQLKMLGIRIFIGLFIFFIPNLVYAVFGLSDKLNLIQQENYKTCADCLLKPNSCNVEED